MLLVSSALIIVDEVANEMVSMMKAFLCIHKSIRLMKNALRGEKSNMLYVYFNVLKITRER